MERAARSWQTFGREDPLWAIVTRPDARGGRWDPEAFFATGQDDVARLVARIAPLHEPRSIRRVLDFGCGVGRLTRALAERFDDVHGVDVAPAMVERARAFDRDGRCTFHVNPHPDLRAFDAARFDLVVSLLTLQHLPRRNALRYLAEFGRVLAPGGLAVFQLPIGPRRGRVLGDKPGLRALSALASSAWSSARAAWIDRVRRRPVMEMHGVPERVVARRLRDVGLELLAVDVDTAAGPDWHSRTWVARAAGVSG